MPLNSWRYYAVGLITLRLEDSGRRFRNSRKRNRSIFKMKKMKNLKFLIVLLFFVVCSPETEIVPENSTEYQVTSRSTVAGDSVVAILVDSTSQFYTGQSKSEFIDSLDVNGQMISEYSDILSVVYDYHVLGTTGSGVIGNYTGNEVQVFVDYLIDNNVSETEFYTITGGGDPDEDPQALPKWIGKLLKALAAIYDLISEWL